MSKNQAPRIRWRTAARKLRGAPVTVPDALAVPLTTAAAPPRDGERAATEVFLEASHRSAVPPTHSRSTTHSRLGRPAAATGHLAGPAGSSSASPSSHPAASASTVLTATPTPHGPSTAHRASASLVGQCRAYTARPTGHTSTGLITVAGGKTKGPHPLRGVTQGSALRVDGHWFVHWDLRTGPLGNRSQGQRGPSDRTVDQPSNGRTGHTPDRSTGDASDRCAWDAPERCGDGARQAPIDPATTSSCQGDTPDRQSVR